MAESEIPAGKIEAYLKTDYQFGTGLDVITLRIDTRSEALARLCGAQPRPCGVFITAYNPLGQEQSPEASEAAHGRLGAELTGLASRVIEGVGADPTGAWPEEKSFFAFGVDLESARQLGIRYRQDAIVWVGEDAIPKLVLLR